jgi:outer membrane receptor protein involved in Fe transport
VRQESVLAYEVGTKLGLFSRMLQLDGAFFYYDYRDKQLNGYLNIPGIGVAPTLVSIPKSTVAGAEISATLRPVTGLTLTANGTYVHTRIDSNPVDRETGAVLAPADYLGNPSSYIGKSFPNTPNWQGTFDAQYSVPVSAALNAYVGSTVTYNSATFGILPSGNAALDPLVKLPEHALLDLRVGAETSNGRWRAELWGRNVTDKYYLIGTIRATDYFSRFSGMPATYGINAFFRY